jgi:hypothetical protein
MFFPLDWAITFVLAAAKATAKRKVNLDIALGSLLKYIRRNAGLMVGLERQMF